jgi:hypothetical protein
MPFNFGILKRFLVELIFILPSAESAWSNTSGAANPPARSGKKQVLAQNLRRFEKFMDCPDRKTLYVSVRRALLVPSDKTAGLSPSF